MSYPTPAEPPAPAERARPTTVTAATWLLLAVAALYVAGSVAMLSQTGTYTDIYRDAYAGTELEGTGEFTAILTTVAGGGINILLAAGFVVLALLDYRGKNPARIITWVLGGVALCCSGLGLVMTGIMEGAQVDTGDDLDVAELQRQLDAALPGWYDTVTWVTSIGAILALIAALILLALPPSNEFFRKQPPPYEPPPPYPQTAP